VPNLRTCQYTFWASCAEQNGASVGICPAGVAGSSSLAATLGRMKSSHHAAFFLALTACSAVASAQAQDSTSSTAPVASQRDDATSRVFKLLGKNAIWTKVDQIAVDFPTFHTQGLVKIGDTLFVSAVEVLESTTRDQQVSTDATYDFSLDRTQGAGRGWLFKFDLTGKLLAKVELTSGAIYHPGGIDYDGTSLWVPVAEYRPNSHSTIYKVDPTTLAAAAVFDQDDHIGGVVHDARRGTLHGVSWGSRRLYTWQLTDDKPTATRWTPNPSAIIDYQDCHFHGRGYMLCGGVSSYNTPSGTSIAFGGLDLVDLWQNRPTHQIPVNQFIDEGAGPNPGLALTHNAFWAEPNGDDKLRFYFMTESDNQADLLIYDATPWLYRPEQ
jgi:hypothetical protein